MKDHDLDAAQRAQLHEACRAKDRLDKLDELLRGEVEIWAEVSIDGDVARLEISDALARANNTANMLKQLLAALRLPDAEGKRPQHRGARGAYGARRATGPEPERPSATDGLASVSDIPRPTG